MPESTDGSTAVLRVSVSTALGALPLEGASVTVSTAADGPEARTLLYAVLTDAGGMTPPLTLPTPPLAGSLSPDGDPPFAVYTVEAVREGYVPLAALHITMFPGIPAMLPLALTPLEEGQSAAPAGLTATGDPQALYHTASGEEA